MDTFEAIRGRRSIRRFRPDPGPRVLLERVLEAACLAPSPKNSQPWRFVVFQEKARDDLVAVVARGVARDERGGRDVGKAAESLRVMAEAPAVVLVLNGASGAYARLSDATLPRAVDVQSIGASIQNLLLAACASGLGALWVCDVLYAHEEVREFLGRDEEVVAAIALGYPAETPEATLRRPLGESVTWAG